jgi:hypothetical protein
MEFEHEFGSILLHIKAPLVNLCDLENGSTIKTGKHGKITVWHVVAVNNEMDIVVV